MSEKSSIDCSSPSETTNELLQLQEENKKLKRALEMTRREYLSTEERLNSVLSQKTWRIMEPVRKVNTSLQILKRRISPKKISSVTDLAVSEEDHAWALLSSLRSLRILADESSAAKAQRLQHVFNVTYGLSTTIVSPSDTLSEDAAYLLLSPPREEWPRVSFPFYHAVASSEAENDSASFPVVFVEDEHQLEAACRLLFGAKKIYYLPLQSASEEELRFFVGRFLLAADLISPSEFYSAASDYIHLPANGRICLNLPESYQRREDFQKENHYGFQLFPALKHRIGWVGCALSYQFLMKKASEQGFDKITICEDDVFFAPDFEDRFEQIWEYTKTHDNWDIFSGIISDLRNANIYKTENFLGEKFVSLDFLVGSVFNIYRATTFSAYINWDETDRIGLHNTIDRYISEEHFRILTTVPFLVGHKEDFNSDIWQHSNREYRNLINESSLRLKELVTAFEQKEQQNG